LRNAAVLARGLLDDVREALVGRVRGKHLVIRRDDADVRLANRLDRNLLLTFEAGETVRQVRAGQRATRREQAVCGVDARKVRRARRLAALDDAIGDFFELRMQGNHRSSFVSLPARPPLRLD
jgi:hypothetical protein